MFDVLAGCVVLGIVLGVGIHWFVFGLVAFATTLGIGIGLLVSGHSSLAAVGWGVASLLVLDLAYLLGCVLLYAITEASPSREQGSLRGKRSSLVGFCGQEDSASRLADQISGQVPRQERKPVASAVLKKDGQRSF